MNKKYTNYGFWLGVGIVLVLIFGQYLVFGLGYILGYLSYHLGLPFMPRVAQIVSYILIIAITGLVGYVIDKYLAKPTGKKGGQDNGQNIESTS